MEPIANKAVGFAPAQALKLNYMCCLANTGVISS